MQKKPSTASPTLVWCIFLKMLDQVCMKTVPDADIPRRSFTCDVKIIRATAEVKPEATGPETKSIMKPGIRSRI